MAEIFERSGRMVRPYAITGGRTDVGSSELSLETQVVSTSFGRNSVASLRWESGRIVRICTEPTAIVEIAARLSVPVGVARVLVADLAADRILDVHQPTVEESTENDSYTQLLEKVLDGIRNL